MGYVFISYSSKNQDIANFVMHYLNDNDITTWMAPNDIPCGLQYAQVINEAIENCSCFILLLSSAAQNSNWVPREVERAVNFGKRIIPVQLESVSLKSDFQLYISVNHTIVIDNAELESNNLKKLVESIKLEGSSPKSTYDVGNIIDGKYEIIERIDYGKNYEVFISQHHSTKARRCVRAVYPYTEEDKLDEITFLVESINQARKISHPAIPGIVDMLDNGDHILIVMDYIDGRPFSRIIQENGFQEEDNIRSWAIQLANILMDLHHDSIFNINLQPNQIVLQSNGDISLRSFVVCKSKADKLLKPTMFTAPEEYNGSGVDARTDIYYLGCLLYSLAIGRDLSKPPYAMYSLRDANPTLSKGMEHIILKCMARNPNKRYKSAKELIHDLENIDYLERRLNRLSLWEKITISFKK